MPKASVIHGNGYAWMVSNGRGGWTICNWAEPQAESLFQKSRPSPEAKDVRVVIIPRAELAALTRREKAVAARERRCAAIEYRASQVPTTPEGA